MTLSEKAFHPSAHQGGCTCLGCSSKSSGEYPSMLLTVLYISLISLKNVSAEKTFFQGKYSQVPRLSTTCASSFAFSHVLCTVAISSEISGNISPMNILINSFQDFRKNCLTMARSLISPRDKMILIVQNVYDPDL